MPEHPTPPGFSDEPGSFRASSDVPDHTAVATPCSNGVARHAALPEPPTPGTRPAATHGRGRKRRLRRAIAIVALALAIFIPGGAVALRFSSGDVPTTRMAQPAAPGAAQQPPPRSLGDGYGGAPSAGSDGGSGESASPADVDAIAAKVSPAIVNITVANDYTSSGGAATGIVLSSDGSVLTNNHVVDGSTDITATDVGNGRTYAATVVGYDATHDIALIKLDGASGLAVATIGDSTSLRVGDTVVGVGNAGGDGGAPTVAAGAVVALDRQIVASDRADGTAERLSGLIQTDANIQSGDSGGPLVDAGGAVVGVMTAASVTNNPYGHDLGSSGSAGYAVPIATAMEVVDQIRSGQASADVHIGETGFLGVQLTDTGAQAYDYGDPYDDGDPYGYGGNGPGGHSGSTGSGATVALVLSGSPAAQAGLKAGDVITAVDGDAVSSASDLIRLVGAHHPGDAVTITWTDSSGAQRSATVSLAKGPAR